MCSNNTFTVKITYAICLNVPYSEVSTYSFIE
jgi:hypothetical protein